MFTSKYFPVQFVLADLRFKGFKLAQVVCSCGPKIYTSAHIFIAERPSVLYTMEKDNKIATAISNPVSGKTYSPLVFHV